MLNLTRGLLHAVKIVSAGAIVAKSGKGKVPTTWDAPAFIGVGWAIRALRYQSICLPININKRLLMVTSRLSMGVHERGRELTLCH